MKWLVSVTFSVIVAAASGSILFVGALKPSSLGAFVLFAAWLLFPYLIMGAALAQLRRKSIATFQWCITVVLVSAGGTLFIADVIFWHPDAQGAIAVLMTPVLQAGALALLLPIAWLVSRNARN